MYPKKIAVTTVARSEIESCSDSKSAHFNVLGICKMDMARAWAATLKRFNPAESGLNFADYIQPLMNEIALASIHRLAALPKLQNGQYPLT
ncbi:hypothetical protein EBR96_10620, partial [bacterium]|nr:hypothetical protein [bacterium]